MSADQHLRRKYTFKTATGANGSAQVVFIKKKQERPAHVWMKAFLWALYLPMYPSVQVEVHVGDKYKPDVVALDPWGAPRFWGEAGAVSIEKIQSLLGRYPRTHFAMAKWDTSLPPFIEIVRQATHEGPTRQAPFDLLRFSADSPKRFIDAKGHIQLTFDDVEWQRL